ncbi:Hypothetical_protein [Hexamita inflata]|uniref:Hypothetical_protein n=1 Tax=Hexamita inflata TaxID=28002 RepID=A0AA86RP21_9EUKA|nr:Hypothetical protein HINF_LOCUS65953 [Hexamita inflata]
MCNIIFILFHRVHRRISESAAALPPERTASSVFGHLLAAPNQLIPTRFLPRPYCSSFFRFWLTTPADGFLRCPVKLQARPEPLSGDWEKAGAARKENVRHNRFSRSLPARYFGGCLTRLHFAIWNKMRC